MATLSVREVVQAARQAGYQVATVERLRPSRWLLTLTDATGAEIVLLAQARPLIISADVGASAISVVEHPAAGRMRPARRLLRHRHPAHDRQFRSL